MPDRTRTDLSGPAGGLSLDTIACPPSLKDQLLAALFGNRLPLLLVGEEGAGKRYIGYRLAAALLCLDPQADRGACGTCPSCRMLMAGSHHDLVVLEPEAGKASIAVAQVRSQVASGLHTYPQVSRNRVYLISAAKAETLNEQGQNALLKPLEDHPDFVRFILMAEDDHRLLPTIVSRSHMVRLGRREEGQIRTILDQAGIGGPEGELAVAYADGLPGQALAIGADPDFRDLRDQVYQILTRLPRADRAACLTRDLDFFKDHKDQRARIFRILESFLRDLLLLQRGLGDDKLINKDQARGLEDLIRAWPETDPARAAALVRQTAEALTVHANYDHSLARLLLGLRAFLAGEPVSPLLYRLEPGLM